MNGELVGFGELSRALDGRKLPGSVLTIEPYESQLADYAVLAPAEDSSAAHPMWLLILALRGMGISVEELGALAGQRSDDTLLFGNCQVDQRCPLLIGQRYSTTASIGPVTRKKSGGGGFLDFVTVRVEAHDLDDEADVAAVGVVTSTYIFKRASR